VCDEISNASSRGIDWRISAWIALRNAARRLEWEYDIQAITFHDFSKILSVHSPFQRALYTHWLAEKLKEDPGFSPASPYT
jgi:hypothetical protein